MSATAAPVARSWLGPSGVVSAYAAVLLLVPSVYTLPPFSVTVAMLVGLVAGVLWAAGRTVPTHGADPPVLGSTARHAMFLYAGTVVVSFVVANTRPMATAASDGADRNLVALVAMLGVGLLACDELRTRAAIERVLGTAVLAAGALAAIGILQYVADFDLARYVRPPGFAVEGSGGFIYRRDGLDRVAATARHPIELGVACAMLVPLGLHLASHGSTGRLRWTARVATVLLAIVLPMTLSRAAVLAVLAAVAVVVVTSPGRRVANLIAAGVALTGLTTMLAPGVLSTLRDLFLTDAAASSNAARDLARQEAFERFRERPVLGRGFGTIEGVIVDNQFLNTMVEMGAVGLVAVALLLNGAVLAARRAAGGAAPEIGGDAAVRVEACRRDLGWTLVAVVAAFVAGCFGLAALVYPMTGGLLFLLVGVAGAAHRITATEAAARSPAAVRAAVPVLT